MGYTPVIFYTFSDINTFAWIDRATRTVSQTYTDFKSLMADIRSIDLPNQQVPSACNLPVITSYTSTAAGYPLDVAYFVGRGSVNDQRDSILMFLWQQSYSQNMTITNSSVTSGVATLTYSMPAGNNIPAVNELVNVTGITNAGNSLNVNLRPITVASGGATTGTFSFTTSAADASSSAESGVGNLFWFTIPSPSTVPVTFKLPQGVSISKVVDTVTLASVAYTQTGTSVILNAADDPVEVLLIPLNNNVLPTGCSN